MPWIHQLLPVIQMVQLLAKSFIKNHEKIEDATVIIVAQRISTILHADQIIVLEDGEMVGIGTHDELLRKNGVYADFFHQQAQWYET